MSTQEKINREFLKKWEDDLKAREKELKLKEYDLVRFANEIKDRERALLEAESKQKENEEKACDLDHLFDAINTDNHKFVGLPVEILRPRETVMLLGIAMREG